MTDSKNKSTDRDQSHGARSPDADRLTNEPGDVNEGHGEEALQEASERMLLRKDRT